MKQIPLVGVGGFVESVEVPKPGGSLLYRTSGEWLDHAAKDKRRLIVLLHPERGRSA